MPPPPTGASAKTPVISFDQPWTALRFLDRTPPPCLPPSKKHTTSSFLGSDPQRRWPPFTRRLHSLLRRKPRTGSLYVIQVQSFITISKPFDPDPPGPVDARLCHRFSSHCLRLAGPRPSVPSRLDLYIQALPLLSQTRPIAYLTVLPWPGSLLHQMIS